jgi:hypothetical protein
MPLFYIAHYDGFVGQIKRTRNVRCARTFPSFEEADEFAKKIPLNLYAILQTPEREITLAENLADHHGYWEEHPIYPLEDWRYEVENGDTRLGYWEWIANCIEREDNEDV